MPPSRAVIAGYVAGNRLDVRRTVTTIPVGRTLVLAWFTVKTTVLDADPGLVQKIITSVAQPNIGQITDTGSGDQAGAVLFQLTITDTDTALGPDKVFYYDIQLKFDNGDIATLEYGEISFVRGVTAARA